MRHICRVTSLSLTLLFVLFAADSTFFRTSGTIEVEASGWQQESSTKQAEPASAPDLENSPQDQAPAEGSTERNKALALKWSDLLRRDHMDLVAAQALITDDWVIHGTGVNFPRGPEGLKQWQNYIDAMWANPHWVEGDVFGEGDKVVRRATVYRTWKPNNKDSAMTVVFIHRISNGKIAETWRVADALSSARQVGARIIMPGTNADSAHATPSPTKTENTAEQKNSNEEKRSQPTKGFDNKNAPEHDTPSEATTERNKVLVTRWAEAIWKKDLAVAQALVTDACVIHAGGSAYTKGPEAVRQWLADGDPNWSYGGSVTDDIIVEGDKVARRTTVFAGYKPNRRGTVTSVVFLYRIADGKIAEVWHVANYVHTYLEVGAQIIMPGANQPSAKKSEAEEEVLKAKQEFDQAALCNDADGRAHFYTDDYTAVYGDGSIGDKATQLERVRSGRLRYSARSADDVIVRVYGDNAVVIERRQQTATLDGKPRPNDVRATEVWVKRGEGWRLASTSITPVRPIEDPAPGPFWASPATSDSTVSTKGMSTEAEAEIPNGANQSEQEVLKASEELTDAARRNDADALSRIYADDYIFVPYNGGLSNKEQQVELVRTGFMKFSDYTILHRNVRVYGETAVVIRHRKQVGTVGARTRLGEVRVTVTSVWLKRQGQWQLVSGQVTPILQPEKK